MTEPKFSEHLIWNGFTYAYGISAADITGNGSLDLVATDTGVGIYLFENDGDGNFTQHVIHKRRGEWLERHKVADINGDGKPEIVVVDNINGCLLYFEFEGDPRSSESWKYHYITQGELPGAYDVTLANFDGTGSLDVAASSWRIGNQFAWFKNHHGKWSKHIIDENSPETRTVITADINGNGRTDLVGTITDGNEIVWYENPGGSATQAWKKHVIDVTTHPMHGNITDMDGDGDIDLVMAIRGSGQHSRGKFRAREEWVPNNLDDSEFQQIVWYENNGTPEKSPWQKHIISAPFPYAFEAIAADIDNDGHTEVVATAWSDTEKGSIALFKHGGNPRGHWDMHLLKTNWTHANQVILADLNNNGRLDIIACAERGSNELRWWRNEGSDTD